MSGLSRGTTAPSVVRGGSMVIALTMRELPIARRAVDEQASSEERAEKVYVPLDPAALLGRVERDPDTRVVGIRADGDLIVDGGERRLLHPAAGTRALLASLAIHQILFLGGEDRQMRVRRRVRGDELRAAVIIDLPLAPVGERHRDLETLRVELAPRGVVGRVFGRMAGGGRRRVGARRARRGLRHRRISASGEKAERRERCGQGAWDQSAESHSA